MANAEYASDIYRNLWQNEVRTCNMQQTLRSLRHETRCAYTLARVVFTD